MALPNGEAQDRTMDTSDGDSKDHTKDQDHAADNGTHTENVGLLSLPPELVYMISGYLSRRITSRLARSCRSLHSVLNPEVYRWDRVGRNRAIWFSICRPNALDTFRRVLEYCPEDATLLDRRYFGRTDKYRRDYWESHQQLTPLVAAIMIGNLAAVQFLVSEGATISQPCADPHPPSGMGLFPIHYAASYCHQYDSSSEDTSKTRLRILCFLLASGANPNQLTLRTKHFNGHCYTPLEMVIRMNENRDLAIVHTLLEAGAQVTRCNHQEHSLLAHLIESLNTKDDLDAADYQIVSLLVRAGAGSGEEAHIQPKFVELLAKPRSSEYFAKIIECLLMKGLVSPRYLSPSGNQIIVEFLRGHIRWLPIASWGGARPNEIKFQLGEAAKISCLIIDRLLASGADINKKGTGTEAGLGEGLGEAAIHVAVRLHWAFVPIFRHLVKKGANVEERRADGCTILHTLVLGDDNADPEMVTRLIRRYKIPRRARNMNGETFLHLLMGSKVQNFRRWAKEVAKNYKRKDLFVTNVEGRTPLHLSYDRNPLNRYRDLADAFRVESLGEPPELQEMYHTLQEAERKQWNDGW